MTNGFKTLEKKYGITVVREGYYFDPLGRSSYETFKIYPAGCGSPWAKGLKRKDVKRECERWSKQLLELKAIDEEERKNGGKSEFAKAWMI